MLAPEDRPETRTAIDEEALIRAHLLAIVWIEKHLLEPMTLKSVAEHAGYSPSRFSRGFTRLQGESVMSYVRGRRLEAAMRRLLTEPDLRLVDLSFDSGFDSQEAFTRAFAKAFGHPPGRLRTLGPVRDMLRRKKASRLEPEIHERVEEVPQLQLAGLSARVTPANSLEMVPLWRRLESLRGVSGALDANTYLVILGVDPHDGGVEMMPSMRIADDAQTPPTLRSHFFGGSTCTVFRHVVRKGDIFPQINAARDVILRRYLSRPAPLCAPRTALEVYPQGLDITPGSWVDHYFQGSGGSPE